MKRLLAAAAAGLGLGALLRRRNRHTPAEPPVDELRAKLAESRSAEEPEADVDARRADVHERARKAIDELGG